MISHEQARAMVRTAFVELPTMWLPVNQALGRILAEPVLAPSNRPERPLTSMDGYAIRAADLQASLNPPSLICAGEIVAGSFPDQALSPGSCCRIFTGAPLPEGADCIIPQEEVQPDADGRYPVRGAVRFTDTVQVVRGRFVRPTGMDFVAGSELLAVGTRLNAREIGLLVAAGITHLVVYRPPRIAVLETGHELVPPGTLMKPGQIPACNGALLTAMIAEWGGETQWLGIVPDDPAVIAGRLKEAAGCDLLLTCGGVSVGDHDHVRAALEQHGLTVVFHRVAQKPAKPLLFGHIGSLPVLGLPGNPVSTAVSARLFLGDIMAIWRGQTLDRDLAMLPLSHDLAAGIERDHFMRARLHPDENGRLLVSACALQDSAALAELVSADALIYVRADSPARPAGTMVSVVLL